MAYHGMADGVVQTIFYHFTKVILHEISVLTNSLEL